MGYWPTRLPPSPVGFPAVLPAELRHTRPRILIEIYPDLVERWVFGYFEAALLVELDTQAARQREGIRTNDT